MSKPMLDRIGTHDGHPMIAALVMGPTGPGLACSQRPGQKLVLLQLLAPILETLRVEAAAELASGKSDSMIEIPRLTGAANGVG